MNTQHSTKTEDQIGRHEIVNWGKREIVKGYQQGLQFHGSS